MEIRRLLAFLLSLAMLIGIFSCAIAEGTDEFVRAIELGFVSEEMAASPDSAITWKQFCEMAGRMIETYDADALSAWQDLTANAPETPMKRDGGLMSMLFVAKAVNLHTFNADYPNGGMADDLWAYATMDYPVFPFNDPIDLGEGVSCICHVGPAYDYCLRRASLVSGKRLLDWDENDSLRFADDFTVREAALAILRLYESDAANIIVDAPIMEPEMEELPQAAAESDTVRKIVNNPFAELEAGELSRAAEWGLVPAEWQDQLEEDITYAEFCVLVRQLVERLNSEQLAAWDEMAALAHDSEQIMGRDDGAVGLLYAAQALGCCTETAWDYPELQKALDHSDTWSFDQEFPLWPVLPEGYQTYGAIPGTPEESGFYSDRNNTIDAAFWFVLLRRSPFNEMPLMSWDADYSLRMGDNLTRREAIVYLWRLVEGEANLLDENNYIPVQDVGSYDSSIITDELLSRPSDLPEVMHSQLPSDWNGVGIGAYKGRAIYREFNEGEFALLEENGLNFVRMFLGFPTLRFPDNPQDINLVNEAEFRDIDQLIAWGIKYGVHIQLSMNLTPSGYMRLGDANDEEWEYIQAYWEALARRYAGIPSRYLTFDLFNEMEPAYDRVTEGLESLKKMVTSLRKIDPDRVLLTSFHSNPLPEWVKGAAKLGLSLGSHPYAPAYLCSGDMTDLHKPAQVSWPYPYFPQALSQGESLIIEGEIGGQVLWLDMWSYNAFCVTFDNGESTDCIPSEAQKGNRGEQPIEVMIPDGVTRLELTPKNDTLLFQQIGIQAWLDSENPQPSNENYLVPHDQMEQSSSGGAHLFWDAESGFSSERNCSPEFIYENKIKPQLEQAWKYGVGLMVNEMGTFAAGWDVNIKKNFDADLMEMLEEHGVAWAMGDLAFISLIHPAQDKLWENTEWVDATYEFEDGRRTTITYSPEMLNVYKEYAALDVDPKSIDPLLLRNDGAVPVSGIYYEALEKGDKGEAVKTLQEALISAGYLSDKADGVFGNKTAEAVEKAQADFGFDQTGVANDAFQKMLYANQ